MFLRALNSMRFCIALLILGSSGFLAADSNEDSRKCLVLLEAVSGNPTQSFTSAQHVSPRFDGLAPDTLAFLGGSTQLGRGGQAEVMRVEVTHSLVESNAEGLLVVAARSETVQSKNKRLCAGAIAVHLAVTRFDNMQHSSGKNLGNIARLQAISGFPQISRKDIPLIDADGGTKSKAEEYKIIIQVKFSDDKTDKRMESYVLSIPIGSNMSQLEMASQIYTQLQKMTGDKTFIATTFQDLVHGNNLSEVLKNRQNATQLPLDQLSGNKTITNLGSLPQASHVDEKSSVPSVSIPVLTVRDVTAELAKQLSEAVLTVGQTGNVHRDIKPSNVMITTDEQGGLRVVLIDFGLATHVGHVGEDIVGTPGFTFGKSAKAASEDAVLSINSKETRAESLIANKNDDMFGLLRTLEIAVAKVVLGLQFKVYSDAKDTEGNIIVPYIKAEPDLFISEHNLGLTSYVPFLKQSIYSTFLRKVETGKIKKLSDLDKMRVRFVSTLAHYKEGYQSIEQVLEFAKLIGDLDMIEKLEGAERTVALENARRGFYNKYFNEVLAKALPKSTSNNAEWGSVVFSDAALIEHLNSKDHGLNVHEVAQRLESLNDQRRFMRRGQWAGPDNKDLTQPEYGSHPFYDHSLVPGLLTSFQQLVRSIPASK